MTNSTRTRTKTVNYLYRLLASIDHQNDVVIKRSRLREYSTHRHQIEISSENIKQTHNTLKSVLGMKYHHEKNVYYMPNGTTVTVYSITGASRYSESFAVVVN